MAIPYTEIRSLYWAATQLFHLFYLILFVPWLVIAWLSVDVLGLFGEHPSIWLGVVGMAISEVPGAWFRASVTFILGLILLFLNLQRSGSVLSSLVFSSSTSEVWNCHFQPRDLSTQGPSFTSCCVILGSALKSWKTLLPTSLQISEHIG